MPVRIKGQTRPKACILLVLLMIVCYSSLYLLVIHISAFKNAKSSHGHPFRPVLCSWLKHTYPSCRSILKVKRAKKHAYPSFYQWSCAIALNLCWLSWFQNKTAEISLGRPLRSWLCIRFPFIAMPDHFQGKTSPKVCITPVWLLSVCYISPALFVIRISYFKISEISRGCPLWFWLCIWLALKVMPIHFQG